VLHHTDKLRGPGFEPIPFRLETVTCPQLVDSKGRLISTVRANVITEAEENAETARARADENALLDAMRETTGMSVAEMARKLDWVNIHGEPKKSKVHRTLKRLEKDKLVKLWGNGFSATGRRARKERNHDCQRRVAPPFRGSFKPTRNGCQAGIWTNKPFQKSGTQEGSARAMPSWAAFQCMERQESLMPWRFLESSFRVVPAYLIEGVERCGFWGGGAGPWHRGWRFCPPPSRILQDRCCSLQPEQA
jgi:hypothetical protein